MTGERNAMYEGKHVCSLGGAGVSACALRVIFSYIIK